jgi:hypothetical protein
MRYNKRLDILSLRCSASASIIWARPALMLSVRVQILESSDKADRERSRRFRDWVSLRSWYTSINECYNVCFELNSQWILLLNEYDLSRCCRSNSITLQWISLNTMLRSAVFSHIFQIFLKNSHFSVKIICDFILYLQHHILYRQLAKLKKKVRQFVLCLKHFDLFDFFIKDSCSVFSLTYLWISVMLYKLRR